MNLEVTEFKSELRFDLRCHLEADMASEANKINVRDNMYMVTRVIKVVDYQSEVKFAL